MLYHYVSIKQTLDKRNRCSRIKDRTIFVAIASQGLIQNKA